MTKDYEDPQGHSRVPRLPRLTPGEWAVAGLTASIFLGGYLLGELLLSVPVAVGVALLAIHEFKTRLPDMSAPAAGALMLPLSVICTMIHVHSSFGDAKEQYAQHQANSAAVAESARQFAESFASGGMEIEIEESRREVSGIEAIERKVLSTTYGAMFPLGPDALSADSLMFSDHADAAADKIVWIRDPGFAERLGAPKAANAASSAKTALLKCSVSNDGEVLFATAFPGAFQLDIRHLPEFAPLMKVCESFAHGDATPV